MVENGKISVTCEFCSANYLFTPDEVECEAQPAVRNTPQLIVRSA